MFCKFSISFKIAVTSSKQIRKSLVCKNRTELWLKRPGWTLLMSKIVQSFWRNSAALPLLLRFVHSDSKLELRILTSDERGKSFSHYGWFWPLSKKNLFILRWFFLKQVWVKIHCPRLLEELASSCDWDTQRETLFMSCPLPTTPFPFSLIGGSNWGKQMFMVYVNAGPGSCANFFMHKFAYLYKAATTCMLIHTVMSRDRVI